VLAFLLSSLPSIVSGLIKDPRHGIAFQRWFGYYFGPARMPVNLLEESFAKERLHTDYSLYLRVLGENIFYVIAVLMVATFFFRRRELRVR